VYFLLQEKPVPIPERPKEWNPKDPPEFVRFYMGRYPYQIETLMYATVDKLGWSLRL